MHTQEDEKKEGRKKERKEMMRHSLGNSIQE